MPTTDSDQRSVGLNYAPDVQIEGGVPIPTNRFYGQSESLRRIFRRMEVGDSFVSQYPDSRVFYRAAKESQVKITVRKLDGGGWRCWRVALFLALTLTAEAAVVTAYCHCARCCGRAGQRTASGAWPTPGVTVAGPRRVPFGTRVEIDGLGVRVVQDRTARRVEGRWDVFMANHQAARQWALQRRRIVVVR